MFESMETQAGDACRECYDLMADALVVPNEWLPKRLQNRKTSGNTPSRIFASLRRAEAVESDHSRIKAEKERRTRIYAERVGSELEPDYDTDGQERLIQYAERSFGRLLARMAKIDDSGMTDAEFMKIIRD